MRRLKRFTVSKQGTTRVKVNEPRRLQVYRDRLQNYMRNSTFRADCSCPSCSPRSYFHHPTSCVIEHTPMDLRNRVNRRSTMLAESDGYQEHHLAQTAIQFFSRSFDDMDRRQIRALSKIHDPRKRQRLLRSLEVKDLLTTFSSPNIETLLMTFEDLFFFGALLPIEFNWTLRFPTKTALIVT